LRGALQRSSTWRVRQKPVETPRLACASMRPPSDRRSRSREATLLLIR
jgi:hypothetical protein